MMKFSDRNQRWPPSRRGVIDHALLVCLPAALLSGRDQSRPYGTLDLD